MKRFICRSVNQVGQLASNLFVSHKHPLDIKIERLVVLTETYEVEMGEES